MDQERVVGVAAWFVAVMAIMSPEGGTVQLAQAQGAVPSLTNDSSTLVRTESTTTDAICLPGTGFDPATDKVIVTPRGTTCGSSTASALGAAFLDCSTANVTCGGSGTTLLACGGLPSAALSSIAGSTRLPTCFATATRGIIGSLYAIEGIVVNNTWIGDGGNDSKTPRAPAAPRLPR
jgi:hypothetical protein